MGTFIGESRAAAPVIAKKSKAKPESKKKELKRTNSLVMNAEIDAFGEACICPGDPLRAKWISDRFLKDAKEINNVRGILGFTG